MSIFTRLLLFSIPGLAVLSVFSSCEVINPSEEIPSYVHIDSISFIDSSSNNLPVGPNIQKITDAWVFIDGRLQGVYELPATFPILREGSSKLTIYAGIMDNGMLSGRATYPFFNSYVKDVNLQRTLIDTLRPAVSYNSQITRFSFVEDFEDPGTLFRFSAKSTVDTLEKEYREGYVFHGNFSGRFRMNSTKAHLEAESTAEYEFINRGTPIYLEMNFKTDVPVNIGLYGRNVFTDAVTVLPKIALYPTTEWKKIYINLTEDIALVTQAKFRLYMVADHDASKTESNVWIDDVKLIYR
jgi:hypothetical protein